MKADQYLSVIPDDLNYFRSHFIGEPIAKWDPPPISVAGKSKRLADIIAWSLRVPLVSERAASVLRPVIETCAQLLPFHEIRGHVYFAMNVLRVERELLDMERSRFKYAADGKTLLTLDSAAFLEPFPHPPPPMFKVAVGARHPFGDIFVSKRFCDAAVENGLTGFELTDPGESSVSLSMSGRSANVVPGIVG